MFGHLSCDHWGGPGENHTTHTTRMGYVSGHPQTFQSETSERVKKKQWRLKEIKDEKSVSDKQHDQYWCWPTQSLMHRSLITRNTQVDRRSFILKTIAATRKTEPNPMQVEHPNNTKLE